MKYAKMPNPSYEPIHLHVAHRQELKKELAWSESILQKLSNFSVLINQMTVQSLAMVIQQDIISFVRHVLKVTREHLFSFHSLEYIMFLN